MFLLYEAFMTCAYCGSRVVQKLRPDEVAGIARGRNPRRDCDFCSGPSEWKLVDWKGTPPSASMLEGTSSFDEHGSEVTGDAPDRILVIDDDDLTVILLRKVLESENCVMDVATDGKLALQHLMDNRYSLVICDIHMPNMDGKRLFRFMDEQALGDRSMILFITGDTSAETRRFLESSGCHYMHKPIQVLQLAARVKDILDARRRSGEP